MSSIIVAFPNIDDANRIKSILVRKGYEVALACNNASQTINMVSRLEDGIVICGGKLKDKSYNELYNALPDSFSMILIASMNVISDCYNNEIICVAMPLKVNDLITSIEDSFAKYRRIVKKNKKPAKRSDKDIQIINEAKELLMNSHGMTEEEAHRYIQKISMDSGNPMVETAQMVLLLK